MAIIYDDDGNAIGIACGRGGRKPCAVAGCTRDGTQLCDFPLTGEHRGKTCDRLVCITHAKRLGRNRDYCDIHAKVEVGSAILDAVAMVGVLALAWAAVWLAFCG